MGLLTFDRAIAETRPYFYVPLGDRPDLTFAYDASRQGHHGTFGAATAKVPGPFTIPRASEIASNQNVSISGGDYNGIGTGSTHMVWIRSTVTTGNTDEVFSRGYPHFLNYFSRPAAGRFTCYWGQANEGEALASSGDPAWNDGRWHLWHWVRDWRMYPSVARLMIYADGHLDAAKNESGNAPGSGQPLTTVSHDGAMQFAGIGFWERPLGPHEIRRMYLAARGAIEV